MEEPKDQMEAGCSVVVCFLLGVGVTIERNTAEVQCRSRGYPASLLQSDTFGEEKCVRWRGDEGVTWNGERIRGGCGSTKRHGKWRMENGTPVSPVPPELRLPSVSPQTTKRSASSSFDDILSDISLKSADLAPQLPPHTCHPQVNYLRLQAASHLLRCIRLAPWVNYVVPFISKGPRKWSSALLDSVGGQQM